MIVYLNVRINYNLNKQKSNNMAKVCEICDRKAAVGNLRSKSRIATKRKMGVNLQSKKIDGKKTMICTSCIKTINKQAKQSTI